MRSNVITGAQVYNNLLSNPFRVDQLRLLVNRPPTPPQSHKFALSEKKVLMLIGGGGGGGAGHLQPQLIPFQKFPSAKILGNKIVLCKSSAKEVFH